MLFFFVNIIGNVYCKNNFVMEPVSISCKKSIFLYVAKTSLLAALAYLVLYHPLGDPFLQCKNCSSSCQECSTVCCLYWMARRAAYTSMEAAKILARKMMELLYEGKLRLYILLETLDHDDFCAVCRVSASVNTEESRIHQGCKCGRTCCRRRANINNN